LLFQLAPSMPRTDATESGLLHTPTAKANQTSPSMVEKGRGNWVSGMWPTPVSSQRGGRSKASIEKGGGVTLQQQVKLWPTPMSSEAKCDTRKVQNRIDKSRQVMLCHAVRLWPTPTTRDYKGGRKPETLAASGRGETNTLNDAVTIRDQHGSLNPTWVEWLMGFPEGWTDLKPSETPLSRKSSSKSGGQS